MRLPRQWLHPRYIGREHAQSRLFYPQYTTRIEMRAAGLIAYTRMIEPRGGKIICFIDELFVSSGCRGRGVAAHLVKLALRTFRADDQLMLIVRGKHEQQESARKFYAKLGMDVVRRKRMTLMVAHNQSITLSPDAGEVIMSGNVGVAKDCLKNMLKGKGTTEPLAPESSAPTEHTLLKSAITHHVGSKGDQANINQIIADAGSVIIVHTRC
jgi:GNAT superfamily N-acetyltransferase